MKEAPDAMGGAPLQRRRGGWARLGPAVALAALLACLAAAPASAPQAGDAAVPAGDLPPPPQLRGQNSVGAADLFAALAEPDRTAEIDALRAIRNDLTTADDPRQRDVARDRLDALLELEERRQPDVPAALVMSSLAARIDTAIAGLEQAGHGGAGAQPARGPALGPARGPALGPALGTALADVVTQPVQTLAMAAAAGLALAVALGAGIAGAAVGRRRLSEALEDARADFAAAGARLERLSNAVAESGGTTNAMVEAAAAASSDATLAAARLAGAAKDAELRLRDCMDAVELRQNQTAQLVNEVESVTRTLPALLARAVDSAGQAGLPGLDAAVARLQGCTEALAAGMPAFTAGAASMTQHAAGLGDQLGALLGRAEEVVGTLPGIAAGLAASAAAMRPGAAELAAGNNMAADGEGAAALDAAIARAEQLVGLLPDVTAGLAGTAAQLRRDTQAQAQAMVDAGVAVAQATAVARAAAESAQGCMQRWDAAAAAQTTAQAALADGAARLGDMAQAHVQSGAALQAAGNEVREAAAAMVAQEAGREAALRDAARAADAALAALPVETAHLMSAASVLPAGLNALVETAARLRAEGGRMAESAGAQARAAQDAAIDVRVAAAALPGAVAALADLAAGAGVELRDAAGQVRTAAAGLAAEGDHSTEALLALAARADSAVGVLPVQAGELAAVAAALRDDAAQVRHAAARLLDASCGPSAGGPDAAVAALDVVCGRLADGVAGLDGAGAAVREAAAQLRLDALNGAQVAHETGAMDARLQNELRAQTGRLAALLDSGAALAQRLEAAGQTGEPGTALADLVQAVAGARDAASLLAARGAAQDAAAARVAQAAQQLAAAARPRPPAPTLDWLGSLAVQTDALCSQAGGLAETALRGDVAALPPGMAADTPALLAAIETCIGGLRGTATALAIASDTARLAA